MGSSPSAPPAGAEKPQLPPLELDMFYAYGYQGRVMFAVRAPFAMSGKAEGLVGRTIRLQGRLYVVVAVRRQITGDIAAGEPVGVEVRPAELARGEGDGDLAARI